MYKVLGVGAFYSVSDSASGRRELLGVAYSSVIYLLYFTYDRERGCSYSYYVKRTVYLLHHPSWIWGNPSHGYGRTAPTHHAHHLIKKREEKKFPPIARTFASDAICTWTATTVGQMEETGQECRPFSSILSSPHLILILTPLNDAVIPNNAICEFTR